jgi:type I restriction enzyme S subunit
MLVEKIDSWNPLKSTSSADFSYIDLSSVDKDKKLICLDDVPSIKPSNAPSRARQMVQQDDVLVATVRPNLNGVARIPKVLNGATASTGYCVLRAKSTKLDSKYLYYWVQTVVFVSDMMSKATGANYPAVSDKIIKESKIPLPPLEEQKRIAVILDKADSVRRKRQQAIDLADDFLRSMFLDMFGDPISNPKGWEVKKLKEISSKIASGNTPKGGSKNYVDEGITFMRSQNVWKNKLLLDDVVYIDEITHESMSKSSLKHKDILMTKTGRINTENSSLGRAAMYLGEDGKANLNGHVYFIRLIENVFHEFVVFILTTREYRDYIRSVCVGGIDKRQLNKNHLEDFPIIYPPKEMQMQFVEKLKLARSMLEKAKTELKESEQMFNALSQKAFAGEL